MPEKLSDDDRMMQVGKAATVSGFGSDGGKDEHITQMRVFVSYRHDDVPDATDRLTLSLSEHLGKDNVFLDIDSIEIGAPFAKVIGNWVGQCDVLLAVIGRGWLDAKDEDGRRRLDDLKDYVRLEIEAGLARDIRVVPVLIHGAKLPKTADIPESLIPLLERNAVELSRTHWDFDVANLLSAIKRIWDQRIRTEAAGRRAEQEAAERAAEQQAARGRTRRTGATASHRAKRATPRNRKRERSEPAAVATRAQRAFAKELTRLGRIGRRHLLAIATVVTATVGAVVLVATYSDSGTGLTTVHSSLLALSFPSAWHHVDGNKDGAKGPITNPLTLRNAASTLTAGRPTTSSPTPGGVPPYLTERLHTPTQTSTVRLAVYPARRYAWIDPPQTQTVLFVLASSSGDIAIVCQGPTASMPGCTKVAGTVRSFVEIEPPAVNSALATTLAKALDDVIGTRAKASALASTKLPARSSPARAIAATERSSSLALSHASVPPRNRPSVHTLVTALTQDAAAWSSLAVAARRNDAKSYTRARRRLVTSAPGLSVAIDRLGAQGFALPPIGAMIPPSRPTVKRTPSHPTTKTAPYIPPVPTLPATSTHATSPHTKSTPQETTQPFKSIEGTAK